MKRVVYFVIVSGVILGLSVGASGQDAGVRLKFKVDEKQISVRNCKVYLSKAGASKNPVTKLQLKRRRFFVPAELRKFESLDVRIVFGKFDLRFNNVDQSLFENEWVVGIKKPPYLEEQEEIPDVLSKKRLIIVYYVEFYPRNSEGRTQKVSIYQ